MSQLAPRDRIVLLVIAVLGAVAGLALGTGIGPSLRTDPAWLGPALVVAALALLVLALLWLPALRRRRTRRGER